MKNSAGKAIKRSIIIIVIITAAIISGFVAEYFYRMAEEANHPLLYSEYVQKYAEKYGIPEYIVYAVIKTESGFSAGAESGKGAKGLMQLMPDTYEWICKKTDFEYDPEKITDPEINICCGVYYLSYLQREFVVWDTVFAAYNAGHGRVREWLADEEISENGHLNNIPIPETEDYVKKVRAAAEIYQRIISEAETE